MKPLLRIFDQMPPPAAAARRMLRLLLLCAALGCAKTTPAPAGLGEPCVENRDCATGFLCAAGRCVLPANLGGCEPNRKRCNGADVEQCGADGLGWSLVTTCPTGCSSGACRPQICSPGARRCEGDATEQCTPAGDGWALVQVCASHCDPATGACKAPICTPFSTRCDPGGANAVQTCDSFGAAYVSTPCATGKICDGGRCQDVICAAGAKRCSGNFGSVETCNDKGDGWVASSTCATKCGVTPSGAECLAAVCAANERRCTGSTLEQCLPDRIAFAFVAFCATGCDPSAGQCAAPVCAPSARRCAANGKNVEVCAADGSGWTDVGACAQACAAGQCTTSSAGCTGGDLRCNGPDAQQCFEVEPGVTQWRTQATCLNGCSSGACAPGGSCASVSLHAGAASVPLDGASSVLVYSDVILGADGSTLPDGTLFTVSVSAPGGSPLPGLASADGDDVLPGVQVPSIGGRVHFALLAPGTAPADFTATATAALARGPSCTGSAQVGFTSAGVGATVLVAEDFTTSRYRNVAASTADWSTGRAALFGRWPSATGGGEDGAYSCTSGTCNLGTSGFMPSFAVLGLTSTTATLDGAGIGLSGGDEVILWDAQGSTSGFSNAGTWEFLRVRSVEGSTATFAKPLRGSYGALGDQGVASQRVVLQRVPHFSSLSVSAGAILTAPAWDGVKGGLLAVRVSGTATVNGEVRMDGAGFRGGPTAYPYWGEDQTGPVSASNATFTTGAGAGYFASGGGYGTAGIGYSNYSPGQTYGLPLLGRLFLGSGGGGGSATAAPYAAGGNGGGAILIAAKSIALAGGNTSRVHADAQPGCLASGGGSGGSVWLSATQLTMGAVGAAPPVSARGGNTGCGSAGGRGGDGRVRLDFFTSDANACARAAPACAAGVSGPLVGQSLDAYDVPTSSSASIKEARLAVALGAPLDGSGNLDASLIAIQASATSSDPPDFGSVQFGGGACPAWSVCFNSSSTPPTQGARFRWRIQLTPQPGAELVVQALQWSLKTL